MIRTAKKLAACVLMLGVLVCGTALSAAAAGLPVEAQNGVSLPWSKDVPAESISTGSYSANMLLGASQQLSPVVKPSYSTDSVVFLTDDSSVLTVSSSGVVQAVGVGHHYRSRRQPDLRLHHRGFHGLLHDRDRDGPFPLLQHHLCGQLGVGFAAGAPQLCLQLRHRYADLL